MNEAANNQVPAVPPSARAGKHVVLAGLGAIGAPLCELLTRSEYIGRLTLVDYDVYEAANLRGQAGVDPADVGMTKVFAQARKARRLRPDLVVEAINARLEELPMGRFRAADLLLTGLDSKGSRREANQRAWWAGVPWIDAGVKAEGRLVRVSVFMPGVSQPCLECGWDDHDYETLAVKRPCLKELPAEPTGAPAYLGALAAALQMAEAETILGEDPGRVEAGKEILVAPRSHKLYLTALRRFSSCRFDHETCQVHSLECSIGGVSFGELYEKVARQLPDLRPLRLGVPGMVFVRQLKCGCGADKAVFCLDRRLAPGALACPRCGAEMAPVGFSMLSAVSAEDLPPKLRDLPLSAAGFRPGDWVTVRTESGLLAFETNPNE
ncbi:MAG TPA: ThiF family adenylyltransferase [Verrucomicrobiota bacterium]|nr:ThiF family adenylyltransferase [Verrucomicrobiota bacterium]